MHAPGVLLVLERVLQVPGPVLDDVPTAGPEQREEQLEALPRRRVLVRAVVDHPVKGVQVVLRDDPGQLLTVGLADAPVRRDAAATSFALPRREVLAVATTLEVDRRVPLEVQHLGPEHDAAAVPDAQLQDALGREVRLSEEAVELLELATVLVEH